MKLAYVNNHYQLGGAETVVRQLHEGALAEGHDSRLYVAEGRNLPQRPGLEPLYPRLLSRLDHSRWRGLINHFAPRRAWTDRAFRKLGASDADLIHVHSYHGHYASLESFASVIQAKPFVWTFHRFWGITGGCDHPFDCSRYQTGCGKCPQVGRFAVGPVDRTAAEWKHKQQIISRLPINVIAPSQHLADRVRQSALGKNWQVHVIPNGINPEDFSGSRKHSAAFRGELGLAADKTSALFVCRDFKDPIKGFPLLEKVLGSEPWSNLQVILAGEHSAWACARLPTTLDIVDLGYIRDRSLLARYFEAGDIFLYASDGENFPCVILEAMAAECCIVTSPVDGVLEQVENGISGLIATNGSANALAETLRAALALSQPERRALGMRARAHVGEKFSESGMLATHLSLYARLVREHDSHP